MDTDAAFARYEAIRHRLPSAQFPSQSLPIANLSDIADEADVFVLDAFGVLNVGERPIPGAAERIGDLRSRGKHVFVLTNAASFTPRESLAKFARLGFRFTAEEIISSRDAGLAAISELSGALHWGVIASSASGPGDLPFSHSVLGDDPQLYDAVQGFLFLSASDWSDAKQTALAKSLAWRPRPLIVANPDLVAPRETGLSLEPGFFGHALADAPNSQVMFHGKPFPSVYELLEARVASVPKERIVMVGDTLHTDILGAHARGWRSVLVTGHGLFAGRDVEPFAKTSGIHATWQLRSI